MGRRSAALFRGTPEAVSSPPRGNGSSVAYTPVRKGRRVARSCRIAPRVVLGFERARVHRRTSASDELDMQCRGKSRIASVVRHSVGLQACHGEDGSAPLQPLPPCSTWRWPFPRHRHLACCRASRMRVAQDGDPVAFGNPVTLLHSLVMSPTEKSDFSPVPGSGAGKDDATQQRPFRSRPKKASSGRTQPPLSPDWAQRHRLANRARKRGVTTLYVRLFRRPGRSDPAVFLVKRLRRAITSPRGTALSGWSLHDQCTQSLSRQIRTSPDASVAGMERAPSQRKEV